MSEEKKEEKSLEQTLIERTEHNAVVIATLKSQIQHIDSIALALAKDATDETLEKLQIKRPEDPKEDSK